MALSRDNREALHEHVTVFSHQAADDPGISEGVRIRIDVPVLLSTVANYDDELSQSGSSDSGGTKLHGDGALGETRKENWERGRLLSRKSHCPSKKGSADLLHLASSTGAILKGKTIGTVIDEFGLRFTFWPDRVVFRSVFASLICHCGVSRCVTTHNKKNSFITSTITSIRFHPRFCLPRF